MKKKILYLFNSAAKTAYKDNLFKILAMPIGAKIEFKYSIKYNVPSDLKDIPPKSKSLIIFVDRYSEGGYTYYPIREATVLKSYRFQNRFFVECQLSEYCCTDDPLLFKQKLKESADRVPELTKGDPNFSSDGYYVQFADEINDNVITGSECWFNTIENISQTEAFKDDPTAFLKLSLKSSKKEETDIPCGTEGLASIHSGAYYSLDIFYYDPDQGGIEKSLTTSFGEHLEKYGPDRHTIGALTDKKRIVFRAKKDLRPQRTFVEIFVESKGVEKYRISLPIQVSSKNLIFGFVLYGSIIMSIPVAKEYWPLPSVWWSLVFEWLQWTSALRLFVALGSLPSLSLK